MPGSGKGTVAKLLAKQLGFTHISIGQLRRDQAKKQQMTIQEYNEWSLKNPKVGDECFDKLQAKMAREQDNLIFDGRMSFYMIKPSLRVYLDVDLEQAAKRIFADEKRKDAAESPYVSVQDAYTQLVERVKNDTFRYQELYGIDVYNKKYFDVYIDTTELTPEQVVQKIIDKYTEFSAKHLNENTR